MSSSDESLSGSAGNIDSNFDEDFDFGFGDVYDVPPVLEDNVPTVLEVFSGGAGAGDSASASTVGRRTGRTNRWIGGYKYTRANDTRNKVSYRCSQYRSNCGGKCDFVKRLQRYTNFVPHTCGQRAGDDDDDTELPPTVTQDVTVQMKREVARKAITMTASRSAIWEAVRAKFYGARDQNLARTGLTREYVLRRVNRVRAEEFGGSVYGQIEVPPWSQVLSDDGIATDTNFLLFHYSYYEKTTKTRERLLGWGHPVLLNMLKQKKTSLFVDGTFRCVPPRFKQCIVFTTYDRATKGYYPCAFVLGTSKKYGVYFHAMRLVSTATDDSIDPEFVYCDFEAGMIRAVRDHFPSAAPIGCLFHFKQACRRKMKKYRISEAECKIAMKRGILDMLTVIPQPKVEKQGVAWVRSKIAEKCALAGLVYSTTKWEEFWGYFHRTWIVKFPPALWNVEPYTRDLVSRTNNPLERFNREMNAAFSGGHTNLPDFAAGVEKLARRYANLKADIELGRARQPTRPPIQLPRPVELPDVPEISSNNTNSRVANDESSDEGEPHFIRDDTRRVVVQRSDFSGLCNPDSLASVGNQ
ncbi:hypothetical protein PR003_g25171 [Phytophthora rubi]|uniref:MULE transposase domain-containing protein n=1 Tax=Phytophthora rubi TaxID=129364 RepID=A0A6A4CGU0_9STRA|nr:hypothetical protein PR003_g25171 [Phytophthora rubi]